MIYKEGNCKKGERKRDLIIKEKKVLLGRMKEESGVKRDHLSKLRVRHIRVELLIDLSLGRSKRKGREQ